MLVWPANTNNQHGFPFNVLHCNHTAGTVGSQDRLGVVTIAKIDDRGYPKINMPDCQ